MGIDVHGLNFLRYAKKNRCFGKTITVGRQELHLHDSYVRTSILVDADYKHEKYCEQLLTNYFGASSVDSIDNSSFENASIIHDMNHPLPSDLSQLYDTVFDGGCLEHIYNIPQALKNCSLLCKPGGQILHVLPANNFCGHGFWQFSPELFFSLYSNQIGYDDTEVFLADIKNTKNWFKVKPPTNGRRIDVTSSTGLYVLVRTVLKDTGFSHNNIQQSDYVFGWSHSSGMTPPTEKSNRSIKQKIQNSPLLHSLFFPAYQLYIRQRRKSNNRNPGLRKIKIKSLVD